MSDALATICAAIASSPADSCALVQVALKTIPFSVKEAFGRPDWSWQAMRNIGKITQTNLDSATGVYAYHLMNINNEPKQNLYVGQTTNNFASRWADHARHRKATKRSKKHSSKFYGNLKLTRPKDISTFILADITLIQKDVLAHKVLAIILEAGFCVFFNSLHSSNLPGSEKSVSFALRWSVVPPLVASPSWLLTSFPSRPSDMPAVPWLGLNFAFPLFQDILLRPWFEEEVEILMQLREREKYPLLSQNTLAEAGFKRSLMAIFSKRRSLGLRDRW